MCTYCGVRPLAPRSNANTCGQPECKRARNSAYRRLPVRREAQRLSRATPEYRARSRELESTPEHKAKTRAYNAQAHVKERSEETRRLRTYGITPPEWTAMVKTRAGRCATCGKKRRLNIDHSYVTGLHRDLLCHGCNTLLGRFEGMGGPELLESLFSYQTTWAAKHAEAAAS